MADPTGVDFEVTLQTLNYATRLLAAELDTGQLIDRALDVLADFARGQRVALLRLDEDAETLEVAGQLDRYGLEDPERHIPYRGTALETVIQSRQATVFEVLRQERLPLPVTSGGEPGRECLCLPLVGSQSRLTALATVERDAGDPLSELDKQVLRVVSTLIAVSFDNARLFKLATVDGLTELYVRRFFEIRLSEELARVRRHGGTIALLMTDIDRFKLFNDTYGHQQGDRVLRDMARLLKQAVRQSIDVPCRYGGEEFVTILPATDLGGAAEVAERIRTLCEATPFGGQDQPLRVTISGGVAAIDQENMVDESELVRRADMALYQAKESGRNRICTWTGD
ncbi:MAG: sensor domain-containing diguanylate cyclase [Fimbriimonadaceae bacterium]|nr:sensor domain-containing diguanylate cyclase [Fimbriimonadaceae bacterium]